MKEQNYSKIALECRSTREQNKVKKEIGIQGRSINKIIFSEKLKIQTVFRIMHFNMYKTNTDKELEKQVENWQVKEGIMSIKHKSCAVL
jgi:hypothetical protein